MPNKLAESGSILSSPSSNKKVSEASMFIPEIKSQIINYLQLASTADENVIKFESEYSVDESEHSTQLGEVSCISSINSHFGSRDASQLSSAAPGSLISKNMQSRKCGATSMTSCSMQWSSLIF